MKLSLITLLLSLICSFAFSQTVEFIKKPWDEVLAMAKEKNMPIFVDVYTQTCGPCKKMDKVVFTNPAFAKLMNDSLISFKVDAGLIENRWVISTYHINAYPTLLYFSPAAELVCKSTGATDVYGVTEITRSVLKKIADPKPLSVWEQEYKSNKANTTFLFDYIKKLDDIGLNTGKVIDEYLGLIPEKERYSKKNIELILRNAESLVQRGIASNVLLTCRDSLMTHYSEGETDEFIDSGIMMYTMGLLKGAAMDTNEVLVDEAISIASNIRSPYLKLPGYEYQMRRYYYELIQDYKKFGDISIKYVETYFISDSLNLKNDTLSTVMALNKNATNFFLLVNEAGKLNKALYWCNRCIELMAANALVKEYFYSSVIDTKANLLYKTGSIAKSLKLKELALLAIPVNDNTAVERATIQANWIK